MRSVADGCGCADEAAMQRSIRILMRNAAVSSAALACRTSTAPQSRQRLASSRYGKRMRRGGSRKNRPALKLTCCHKRRQMNGDDGRVPRFHDAFHAAAEGKQAPMRVMAVFAKMQTTRPRGCCAGNAQRADHVARARLEENGNRLHELCERLDERVS